MKHTKGNWKVSKLKIDRFKIISIIDNEEGFETIAVTNSHLDEIEEEANAKLIASAPEMLDTLIMLKKHFLDMDGACDHRISEAIAKATL